MRYNFFSFVCYFFYFLTYSSNILAGKIDLIESEDITIIAFGSCNDQSLSQNFWKNIQAYKPDVFLQIGDNVYAKNKNLISLIDAYKDLKNNIYYQNFSLKSDLKKRVSRIIICIYLFLSFKIYSLYRPSRK